MNPRAVDHEAARPAVLVVDDRPDALLAAFDNADFRIVPCRDGREALRLAHDQDFAAVVLDAGTGYEAAGLLRQEERHRHTPILFLIAAEPTSVEMAVAYSLGAVDFLSKPVNVDALRAKLSLFVDLRRQALRLRREAEDALRAGRALSSSAVESTGALVFAKDADGRYLLANAAFAAFFGKPQTEIVGRFDRDLLPPAVAEELRENDRRIMEQGRSITFEERVPGAKGVRVYHLCTKSPLRGPDGRVCGVIGVAQDITPLKTSEDAAARLAAIVEGSADAILSESLDGEILTWNRAAERMFGYPAEEAIGRPSSLLVPPDRRAELGPALDRARAGQSTLYPETVRLRKGGILFWAQVSVSPIKDRVGAVAGLSTTVRDVSEARRMREAKEEAERATLRSRETLQRILDGAISAWITIDARGRITAWNPQAERTFGRRREDVLGRTLTETIIPPRLRDAHERGLRRLADGGAPRLLDHRIEISALRADGVEIPVELTISAVHGEDGTAYSAFVRDLTPMKRTEARLRLQYAVTRLLSEAPSLEDAAPDLLREVCEVLGWDVGALWQMNENGQVLRCRAQWHRAEAPIPAFGKASRERTFAAGEGLPGRIWTSGRPEWIEDLGRESNFPRGEAAAADGLRSGFGLPVLIQGKPTAILEFFSRTPQAPDASLLEVLGALGAQIGQFTERRLAERALRESEERFRLTAEAVPEILFSNTADGACDYASARFYEYTGVPSGAALDPAWRAALHPEDAERTLLGWTKAFEEGRPREMECRLRRHDGAFRWFHARSVPFRDASGRVVRWFGVATDVDDVKRSESRLRFLADVGLALAGPLDPEAILARVAELVVPETADYCFLDVVQADGTFRRAAWRHRSLGAAFDEIRLHVPPRGTSDHPSARAFREGKGFLVPEVTDAWLGKVAIGAEHLRFMKALGPVALLSVPLLSSGRVRGILTCALTRESGRRYADEDLRLAEEIARRAAVALERADLYRRLEAVNETLERRVEERTAQLTESVREMEAFTYSVSHDLRAPLRAMSGFGVLLKEEFAGRPLDGEALQYLERITTAAQRMDALIQGLLQWSRLSRAEMGLEAVDLDATAAEVRQEASEEIGRLKAEVVVDAPLGRVRAHRLTLRQALTNLLSNALKFTPPGVPPRVRVRSERRGDLLRVWVEDRGIGIAAEHLPRLFGVFERLHRSEDYPGTGIGLAIVRKSIERMGGQVGVESEPGKGSRFWFELASAD